MKEKKITMEELENDVEEITSKTVKTSRKEIKAIMNQYSRQLATISNADLSAILELLANRQISTIDISRHFRCRLDKFKHEITKREMRYPTLKLGRPINEISTENIKLVTNYRDRFNVGYHRAAKALRRRGNNITDHQVYVIYGCEDLFLYDHVYQEESTHINRFDAEYANQLWHTDLHYFDKIIDGETEKWTYLIAFIDNRTRYMLHLAKINDKTMDSTSKEFQKCIEKWKKPYMITIDNGKEFVGETCCDNESN